MDEKDNVTEQLKELVEAYDFNIDTLSKYLGLPADKVKILSQGDIFFCRKIICIGSGCLIRSVFFI